MTWIVEGHFSASHMGFHYIPYDGNLTNICSHQQKYFRATFRSFRGVSKTSTDLGTVDIHGMCYSLTQSYFPLGDAQDVAKDHFSSSGAKLSALEKISAIPSSGLGEYKHLFANEHSARPAPIPRLCQVDR